MQILKTCVATCVLTQAWIDLYVPRLTGAVNLVEPQDWSESKYKYQQCLLELTKAFCMILRRLNDTPQSVVNLLCNGKTHLPLLLRQCNAELVAIALANLAPAEPRGFAQLWNSVQEVCLFLSKNFQSISDTDFCRRSLRMISFAHII